MEKDERDFGGKLQMWWGVLLGLNGGWLYDFIVADTCSGKRKRKRVGFFCHYMKWIWS